ncbi:hypothetical protein [Alcanivorax sp. 1008]|uniref:hypothetical protein n=1 Tax=Alcanivorax sp. 1008 TaxID=2816853 RepID=UPI001D4B9C67|nr:hypothetical protein [Alcanivorax sp. 1008]MCC1497721.1 hypothetical protein [Alcanivorax sp. 1008]
MSILLRLGCFSVLVLMLAACNEREGAETIASAERAVEVPDNFLRYLNDQQGAVLSTDWSAAYYRAVDPISNRTTLQDWKAANQFGQCDEEVHVVFRDAKDLGYGRNMRGCRHADGRVAIFVDNYVVRVQPSDPSNYGPINVEAAISEDRHHKQGTNAIEFTPIDPTDPDSDKVAKFFTFDQNGLRSVQADLDGRGNKPMPQPCLLCHGATLAAWDSAAIVASLAPWAEPGVEETLKSAKLNLLELESFDYSPYVSRYSRSQQEEPLRLLNRFILDTYQQSAARPLADPGHWSADFAVEVASKRYLDQPELLGQVYQDDSVPCGWRVNPSIDADCVGSVDLPSEPRQEGVDLLYKRVVEPNCIGCHSVRGSSAGERQGGDGNAINFSNYEKFIGYSDLIVDYVYHRGVMPLSLRNYEKFWADRCDGAPALLASFLPEFDRYDEQACVITPGLPVAKPGASRPVDTPVLLDASGSLFARDFQWQVLSLADPSAVVSLSSPSSSVTQFDASHEGDYVLRLTVSNLRGSHSEDVTLTVDNSLSPAPSQLTFADHVLPVLRDISYPGRVQRCTDCHSATAQLGGAYAGIPVVYDVDATVYAEVIERVDLDDPENSLLLRKPTRDQHGGGMLIDRSSADGMALYQMLINWIRNGADCGADPLICG